MDDVTSVMYEPPTFDFEGKTYELGRLNTRQVMKVANIFEERQDLLNKLVTNKDWAQKLGSLFQTDQERLKRNSRAKPLVGMDYLKQHSALISELGLDMYKMVLFLSDELLEMVAGMVKTDGKALTKDEYIDMPISFQPLVFHALSTHPDLSIFVGNLSPLLSRFGIDLEKLKDKLTEAANQPTSLEKAAAAATPSTN